MARVGLSVLGAGYSGTSGSVVFVRLRDGSTRVRERGTPHNPNTLAQAHIRELMRRANAYFRDLSPEEMAAWKSYAERLADEAWAERRIMQVNPLNTYRALALKFLQVNGVTEPPRLPPAVAFVGDSVSLSASAEPGRVHFTASHANAPGMVTELMSQPLRLSISNPDPNKYRHGAFVAFTPGTLQADLPAARGWLSPAYRFVLTATGQVSMTANITAIKISS